LVFKRNINRIQIVQPGVLGMTASKNVGRGGARKGAGRKKKPAAPPLTDIPEATGQSAEALAKAAVDIAMAVLVHVAVNGESEAARVSAAEKIINRAAGMPKPGTAAKPDQPDLFDDGWDELLRPSSPAAGRAN
jgi:hypothetical protein